MTTLHHGQDETEGQDLEFGSDPVSQ